MNGFIVVLLLYKGMNCYLHLQVFNFAKIRKTGFLTIVNFAKIRKIGVICSLSTDKFVRGLSSALCYGLLHFVFSFLRK